MWVADGFRSAAQPEIFLTMATSVADWAAIVIALVALGATFWDHRRQQRHDRLSVQPEVGLDRHVENGIAHVLLVNRGLGPALLKSIHVYAEGDERISRRIRLPSDLQYMLKVVEAEPLGSICVAPGSGAVLAAGESKVLYKYDFTTADVAPASAVRMALEIHQKLSELGFFIQYESLYGDEKSSESPPRSS